MIPYRDLNRTRHFPWITIALIAANLAAFVWEIVAPDSLNLLYQYAVIPAEFRAGHNLPISTGPPPIATVFSAMFIHGGALHLIGNMLYLWIFGDNVEDRMGPFRFLLFYLLCGVVATFSQIYANFHSTIPVLGASGAIAGVLAAYLFLFPRARVLVLVPVFFFLRSITLPAWLVLGGWVLLQVVQAQSTPHSPSGGVAYFAHIGGFVSGALLLPLFKRRR